MANEIVMALIALFLAIVISLILRRPAERLVKYLYSLSPKQTKILIAIELIVFVLFVIWIRNI